MPHYLLDQDGWPIKEFARPQPQRNDLVPLPERPSHNHRWDGNAWVEDAGMVAKEWMLMIEKRSDRELSSGIIVTVGGVDYRIGTGPMAMAQIAGGATKADRARQKGKSITEKVPTDKGIVSFDEDGIDAIFDAVDSKRSSIMDRVEELLDKVKDGTISEADLESGWP